MMKGVQGDGSIVFRLRAPCCFRFREKASVFLTELHPASDAEARSRILGMLRKRDFDATHHCSAWRGSLPELPSGWDDDGEPSGTAGLPMLRVLEGEDLVDVLAVCVRWFGGTKLGTGGLVRAYTEGVQGALREAHAQNLFDRVRLLRRGSLSVPAGQSHLPFTLLGAFPEVEVVGQHMGESTFTLEVAVAPEMQGQLEAAWQTRSRGGRIQWEGAVSPSPS